MRSERAGQRSQWLVVAVLAAIYTCALVDRFLLALLVDPMKADLGMTDVQVSLTIGLAFSLFYGLLSLPAGFLTDRVGRRGLVGAAAIGWSLATALCGSAASFTHLFVARAGVGTAEAFISPASLSLIRDRVDERVRGRAFSIFAMGPNVGGAIALAGGGLLLAAAQRGAFASWPVIGALHPWQAVLVLVGLAGLLPVLPLLLLARDDPAMRAHLTAPSPADYGGGALWRHLAAAPASYVLLIGYVTTAAMLAFGINGWMPAMMSRKFGLPLSQIGVISGPISLVMAIAGLLVCGFMIDRIARRGGEILHYGLIAGAMAAAGALCLALAPSVSLAWLAFAVTIFFMGSFYAVGVTTLARITPAGLMGKATALYLIFQSSIGGALAPTIVAGWSTLFTGKLAIAYGLAVHSATMGVVSMAICAALARHLRRRAVPPEGNP